MGGETKNSVTAGPWLFFFPLCDGQDGRPTLLAALGLLPGRRMGGNGTNGKGGLGEAMNCDGGCVSVSWTKIQTESYAILAGRCVG
jgi:hypothetical protein